MRTYEKGPLPAYIRQSKVYEPVENTETTVRTTQDDFAADYKNNIKRLVYTKLYDLKSQGCFPHGYPSVSRTALVV